MVDSPSKGEMDCGGAMGRGTATQQLKVVSPAMTKSHRPSPLSFQRVIAAK